MKEINKYIETPLANLYRQRVNYTDEYTGEPWHMNFLDVRSKNDEAGISGGSYGNPSKPTYYGSVGLPGYSLLGQYIPDYAKNVSTPLGDLAFDSNDQYANELNTRFTPNEKTNYYIQALANLLRGR